MIVDVSIQDQGARERLTRLHAALNPAGQKRLMSSLGVGLLRLTRRAFRDPAARPAPWPPAKSVLRRTRVASGKKGGTRRTLLRDTGLLYDSLTWYLQGTDTLLLGSAVPYAAAHQFGSNKQVEQNVPAHRRTITQAFGRALASPVTANVHAFTRHVRQNIPARPFFPVTRDGHLTPQGVEVLDATVERHLQASNSK